MSAPLEQVTNVEVCQKCQAETHTFIQYDNTGLVLSVYNPEVNITAVFQSHNKSGLCLLLTILVTNNTHVWEEIC